jgi:hypothetical protein
MKEIKSDNRKRLKKEEEHIFMWMEISRNYV